MWRHAYPTEEEKVRREVRDIMGKEGEIESSDRKEERTVHMETV
jgi:hypothetical protein